MLSININNIKNVLINSNLKKYLLKKVNTHHKYNYPQIPNMPAATTVRWKSTSDSESSSVASYRGAILEEFGKPLAIEKIKNSIPIGLGMVNLFINSNNI